MPMSVNTKNWQELKKPIMPAEDHEIALPWASVMVIMVLLKLALTWATPLEMFLRSRRLMRWGSRAMGVVLPGS